MGLSHDHHGFNYSEERGNTFSSSNEVSSNCSGQQHICANCDKQYAYGHRCTQQFDIEVEEREAAKIKTVQEALDYIATLTEE